MNSDRRRGWWWFFRRFGARTTARYWLAGQQRGWLKPEQFPGWLRDHGLPVPPEVAKWEKP